MPLVIPAHIARAFSPTTDRCRDGSGMRAAPERVVLGVAPGVTPSPKPPVRIFLGTEPAQYRAERVFVWSIERVRDPSRVYEIHLMKELAGFNRRRWLTGFTNYRFAIPHYAGGAGRAIWNDVDQAYLADPAELFDTDMADHGFLAIAPGGRTDTAVMLMDCARMTPIWTLEGAQHRHKNRLIAQAATVPGLRGDLAPEWHAREEEYVAGRTKCLHWTILHTQPWRPLPQLFVYQPNPVGEVWHDLKRAADRAGYRVFTSARPSVQYTKLLGQLRSAAPGRAPWPRGLRDLATKAAAETILEVTFGGGEQEPGTPAPGPGLAVTRYDPAAAPDAGWPAGRFDGVVCPRGLEFLPDEDVPWVVDELFARAGRFIHATCHDRALTVRLADGGRLHSRPRDRSWWIEHFEAAAAHHPEVHWELVSSPPPGAGPEPIRVRQAGRCLAGPPAVWVLADGAPDDTAQSLALAEALGWPYQVKDLDLDGTPAWPEIVIAAGDRAAAAARSIGQRTRGRTHLVQIQNTGGQVDEWFDAVITPAYLRLPPHPRRIETTTRLTRINPDLLAERAGRAPDMFGNAARPRVVLLAGDATEAHGLDAATARRLAEQVRRFARDGSVFAFTGPRMGAAAAEALAAGLGQPGHPHPWRPEDRPENRDEDLYLAHLAAADAIIVTGASESMLADAVATAKPVYIYPVPKPAPGPAERMAAAVLGRSRARPLNRRGTVRPQQGPEYLCARLIERGVVRPPRDLAALHRNLIRLGVARPFAAGPEGGASGRALRQADEAAGKVRALLGLTDLQA